MAQCFRAILSLSLGGDRPAQDTWLSEQSPGRVPAPLTLVA